MLLRVRDNTFKEASGTGANISQPLFFYSSCWELNLGLRNGSPMPQPLGHGDAPETNCLCNRRATDPAA